MPPAISSFERLRIAAAACLLSMAVGCNPSPSETSAPTTEEGDTSPDRVELSQSAPESQASETAEPPARRDDAPSELEPEEGLNVDEEELNIDEIQYLAIGDFAIGELTIGSETSEAIALLGEPDSKEDNFVERAENGTWIYDGVATLFTDNERIWGMIATDPSLCNPSGVCPGDDLDSVTEALGITPISSDENGRYLYYSPAEEEQIIACWMEVYLEETDDVVRDLRLACQP